MLERAGGASNCTSPTWTTSKSIWSRRMRIDPKDFQDDAVLRLTQEIELARREIDLGRPQAVVLSSPTGSGKTVIMTLLIVYDVGFFFESSCLISSCIARACSPVGSLWHGRFAPPFYDRAFSRLIARSV